MGVRRTVGKVSRTLNSVHAVIAGLFYFILAIVYVQTNQSRDGWENFIMFGIIVFGIFRVVSIVNNPFIILFNELEVIEEKLGIMDETKTAEISILAENKTDSTEWEEVIRDEHKVLLKNGIEGEYYCPQCKLRISEKDDFCGHCGKNLKE